MIFLDHLAGIAVLEVPVVADAPIGHVKGDPVDFLGSTESSHCADEDTRPDCGFVAVEDVPNHIYRLFIHYAYLPGLQFDP